MKKKSKVIKKNIANEDKFSVNLNFRSKFRRIQINAIQKKETRQDSEAVHDKVLQDRKYQVDAAIVKTMKGRKTLKHNDLLTEVIRLTRFPCEVDYIVTRIKHLIEGEYMEPDRNDDKLYHYSLDIWSTGCTMAGMIFRVDTFFKGSDNFDQLIKILKVLGEEDLFAYVKKYNLTIPKEC